MSADVPSPLTFAMQDVRETFLRWEFLRLIYNVVLVVVTCVTVFSQRPDAAWQPEFLWCCVVGAVAANICFFAGPIAESYLRWLGLQTRMLGYALFGAGMLFSLLVNQVACFAFLDGEKF